MPQGILDHGQNQKLIAPGEGDKETVLFVARQQPIEQ